MQIATLTITVESDGKRFDPASDDINAKAQAKLKAGQYTCDIADAPISPSNAS